LAQRVSLTKRIRISYFPALLLAMLASSAGSEGLPPVAIHSKSSSQQKPHIPQAYAGDAACSSCHEEESRTYSGTAHHGTSRMPSRHSILGKFTAGSNILRTSNPYLSYVMNASKDGYFQSAVEQIAPSKAISRTERIDLVIGSGRKGQTYLFWKGNKLFELPVSYWTKLDSWINSPGYPDGSPHFDKPVVPRCLECHSTYFEPLTPSLNRFNKGSLVLGITCERCHGPGREHVILYSSKSPPSPNASKFIINPAALPRDRQIDVCALCHAGAGTAIAPPLSFISGKAIDDYVYIPYSGPDARVDVHGNQVELLKRSRCFQSSSMTCTTCHDVHKPQRDAAAFSPHCLSCHKAADCGEFPKKGEEIAHDCVDCHMPLQESEALVSSTSGREVKPWVRNHRIGIYADATSAVPRGDAPAGLPGDSSQAH
jgi:hypothetical protein